MPAQSRSASLPPPVGGWDAREAIADMPPENAVVLDNWFPLESKVQMRRGFASHATGIGSGAVESLLVYSPLSGNQVMFACGNGAIYNATAAGAVGAAAVSGLANNRWQHVNFGTAGGYFLFACNGSDTPRTFNGTTWANTTITGPTVANLIWCNSFKARLFVGEAGSLSFWYGGAGAIGGAFTEFPLYSVAKQGGFLVGMGTWTRDAGDGQDDVAVFLTSEGEVLVYQGSDPSSASDWSLVGVFRVAPPIGRRCIARAGGDLIVITEAGFLSLAAALDVDRSRQRAGAISAQIDRAVNEAARLYAANFGWDAVIYPRGTMLIFNVPTSATTSEQFVFNTITGKPCRFTGQHARCWALLNDQIYFGGHAGGVVYRADTGTSDNGANITADAVPAFNYFGARGAVKQFQLAEVVLENGSGLRPVFDMNVDFNIKPNFANSSTVPAAGAVYGTAIWDADLWAGSSEVSRGWRSVRGVGRAGSLRVKVTTNQVTPSWLATNVKYAVGGPLR